MSDTEKRAAEAACTCANDADDSLARQNAPFRLDRFQILDRTTGEVRPFNGVKVAIKSVGRGGRGTFLLAQFCPFCGAAYPQEATP